MSGPRYVNIDRETPMLLPVDLREWIKEDDLAHFIVEVIKGVDCSQARVNQSGSGNEQYPPAMMLGLLIYAYASGMFSSRVIERATHWHLSIRYLSGNTHPDHDTICTFRRQNDALLRAAFKQVLTLGALAGLGQVGTVCIDGTKILAQASKRRSLTCEQMDQLQMKLTTQIDELLEEAKKADENQCEEASALPKKLANKQRLRAQIVAAREHLHELTKERAQAREEERAVVKAANFGNIPLSLSEQPAQNATINLTDPDSRIMPTSKKGFVQGYNAQLAVSGEAKGGLILCTSVCNETSDLQQLETMVAALPDEQRERAGGLEVAVDAGYDNVQQIRRVESGGKVTVYCPIVDNTRPAKGPIRVTARRKAAQEYRYRVGERAASDRGKHLRQLRSTTVEPVIGIIKQTMKWRRPMLRGLRKVDLEWRLVALAFNCRRLSQRYGPKGRPTA